MSTVFNCWNSWTILTELQHFKTMKYYQTFAEMVFSVFSGKKCVQTKSVQGKLQNFWGFVSVAWAPVVKPLSLTLGVKIYPQEKYRLYIGTEISQSTSPQYYIWIQFRDFAALCTQVNLRLTRVICSMNGSSLYKIQHKQFRNFHESVTCQHNDVPVDNFTLRYTITK